MLTRMTASDEAFMQTELISPHYRKLFLPYPDLHN
jgi:hypothetical protein